MQRNIARIDIQKHWPLEIRLIRRFTRHDSSIVRSARKRAETSAVSRERTIGVQVPEEILSAEQLRFPGETLVLQRGSAIEAADTLDVPCSVQNIQQVLIHNW